MSYTSVSRAGTDHTIWLNGVGFYKDEIHVMESRLAEVATKNTSFEVRQGVEHFQNQFIVQRNNIDELKHEVNLYVAKLANDSLHHAGHVEDSMLVEKIKLHDSYESLERIMKDLRQEFNTWLSIWM